MPPGHPCSEGRRGASPVHTVVPGCCRAGAVPALPTGPAGPGWTRVDPGCAERGETCGGLGISHHVRLSAMKITVRGSDKPKNNALPSAGPELLDGKRGVLSRPVF